MAKRGSDYIPSYGEVKQKSDDIKEYMATHEDPRGIYEVTYDVKNMHRVEQVYAWSSKDAIDIVVRDNSMVGWFPENVHTKEIKKPKQY